MLKMFKIDDGEQFWYTAETKESAVNRHMEEYELSESDIEGYDIVELSGDSVLTVYYSQKEDAPQPLIGQLVPKKNYPDDPYPDYVGYEWKCVAPVSTWLASSKSGDLICSTVY